MLNTRILVFLQDTLLFRVLIGMTNLFLTLWTGVIKVIFLVFEYSIVIADFICTSLVPIYDASKNWFSFNKSAFDGLKSLPPYQQLQLVLL